MEIETEMCILRNNLRKEGLSTKGIYLEEFRRRSLDEEKKWHRARELSKKRMEELADLFPFAFGKYTREKYEREFISQFGA